MAINTPINTPISTAINCGIAGESAAVTYPLLTYLKASYDQEEASGNALDSYTGGHDMLDNNTVQQNDGVGAGQKARLYNTNNSEYFSLSHNSDFVIADSLFEFHTWVYLNSIGGFHWVFCKGNEAASSGEYGLAIISSNVARWRVRKADNSGTVEVSSAALSLATWHSLRWGHNPDTDQIFISLDDATPVTAALSGGVFNGTNAVRMGSRTDNFGFANMRHQATRVWKGGLMSAADATWLHNTKTAARRHADLAAYTG